jgi:RNA polymerase sigma factor (sigma-70 family)
MSLAACKCSLSHKGYQCRSAQLLVEAANSCTGWKSLDLQQIANLLLQKSWALRTDDARCNAKPVDNTLRLQDETTMKQDGVLLEQDIQTSLNDAVDILSERERHVLCLRYGLKQDQGRLGSKVTIRRRRTTKRKATSLQRVSSQIDLSRERVRQVESQALLKLREVAGDNVTEALGEMTDRPRKVTRGNKASRRPQ